MMMPPLPVEQGPNSKAAVWIVEDEAEFRGTLVRLIDRTPDFRCAAAFDSVEAMQAVVLAGEAPPALVLMDIRLPGVTGTEGVEWLVERCPSVRIVMLTVEGDGAMIRRALNAGAVGYLLKGRPREELLLALREARRGAMYFPPPVATRVFNLLRPNAVPEALGLTPRELEILRLVRAGLSHKLVAQRLGVSHSTVNTHLKNTYAKLGVHSDKEALALAFPVRDA